jgi:hypothetical protein
VTRLPYASATGAAIGAAVLLLLSVSAGQCGKYVDDPCPVPEALTASRADFTAATGQFRTLLDAGAALDRKTDDFNARCDRELPVGSSTEVDCAKTELALNA